MNISISSGKWWTFRKAGWLSWLFLLFQNYKNVHNAFLRFLPFRFSFMHRNEAKMTFSISKVCTYFIEIFSRSFACIYFSLLSIIIVVPLILREIKIKSSRNLGFHYKLRYFMDIWAINNMYPNLGYVWATAGYFGSVSWIPKNMDWPNCPMTESPKTQILSCCWSNNFLRSHWPGLWLNVFLHNKVLKF